MIILVRIPIEADGTQQQLMVRAAREQIATKLLRESDVDLTSSITITLRVKRIRDRSQNPTVHRYAVTGRLELA